MSRSSKNSEKMQYFPQILEENRFNAFLEIMECTVGFGYSENLSKPLILVADDEPFILQYIAHVLQLANYRVITVNTVEEAWKIFERRQPAIELVLTDVVMPGSVDGMELAERIHQFDPSLPVLFVTGALSESDPRTALMIEKQLVLRKPFFPKQLVDFVGAQIQRQSSSGLAR